MKQLFIFLIINCFIPFAEAQTDSIPVPRPDAKTEKIAASRRELLQSFLMDDPAGAGLWMDSLARLEDESYAGLVWDERWLLYFWTDSYGTLLEEVSQFDENQRAMQSWKVQPAQDSLFEWVDYTMHERRYDLFGNIQNAFLTSEEKAMTSLLLEYLLRLNTDEEEWADRLTAFETHFPESRFLNFVHSIKPVVHKPTKQALGISGGLLVGNWNGKIERTLATPYAFDMDVYFWSKRWNYLVNVAFGGPALLRDVVENGDVWPEDDPTNLFLINLQLGYDIINAPKIRVFPTVGGGLGFLKPPTPSEDEDPLPDYYSSFEFNDIHLNAALNADIKLFQKNYRNWSLPKGSYHGIRLTFGWNKLRFGKQNAGLEGNMFYFAVHYNLFAILAQ